MKLFVGRLVCTLFNAILVASCAFSQTAQPPAQAAGYRLNFIDTFDQLSLSPDGTGTYNWYEGVWFNHKHAPLSNITAASSVLSLVWQRGQESPDTSIETLSHDKQHYHAWRYGYFEARMKWNPVNGAWPAFWLIPVQDALGQAVYQGKNDKAEFDIFEGQGDHPHTFYGTVHEWVNQHDSANKNNTFQLSSDVDFSQFHTYGLLWVPGQVTWYFDDSPLHSESTPAVADLQDYLMILGMQEGPNWKIGDLTGVSASRMTLQVDYVRVWQK
jgi:beta-glucanase (GH16 family)